MKLSLDQSIVPTADSGSVLELSYEIPYTSLTFVREAGKFVARFEIIVEVSDARRNVLAGDIWQKSMGLGSYEPSVAKDSVATGTVSLRLVAGGLDCVVTVRDRASERKARAGFRLERPAGGIVLRLYKSGAPLAGRKYGLGDTIEALAEVLSPGDSIDSVRFAVLRERRVVTGGNSLAVESTGRTRARFLYPIADSGGMARLGSGEYVLEASGFGPGRRTGARVGFRVDVPFFCDDSTYLERVDQLLYVASVEEMRRLRGLPRAEREQTWVEFWKKKDPTPTTEQNEREAEYFERIDYADEHFGRGDRGYASDRGRVYVLYGPPDQVENRPFEVDAPAYEIWYYYEVNKRFTFVDKFGAGEYVLANPAAVGQ
jgi:GWxTD domain-containing protein